MRSRKFSVKPALGNSVTQENARPSRSIHPRPIPSSRKEFASPESSLPEVQTDFAELENGSIVDIVEDSTDPDGRCSQFLGGVASASRQRSKTADESWCRYRGIPLG